MPGSGKSTVGELLAKKLKLKFIDLDSRIEMKEGKSIKELFSEKGENYFRHSESNVLLELLKGDISYVMATGGGTPCFYGNIDKLNESGVTFYLNSPVEQLTERTKADINRPLLQNKHLERIRELLQERKMDYLKANFQVEINGLSPQQIVERIESQLRDI